MATFREGVRQLDRLADSGGDVMRDMEIAALTMVAEQIDPSLVPEIFWRALAARPTFRRSSDESDGSLTATAMLLSRFDRALPPLCSFRSWPNWKRRGGWLQAVVRVRLRGPDRSAKSRVDHRPHSPIARSLAQFQLDSNPGCGNAGVIKRSTLEEDLEVRQQRGGNTL